MTSSRLAQELENSTVDATKTGGLLVVGHANVEGSLVTRTRAGRDGLGGRGISASDGGHVSLVRSVVIDNGETGIAIFSGAPTLEMRDSTVEQTDFDPSGAYGIGVLFGDRATGTITTSTVVSSKGVGVAVAAAGASVKSSFLSRNAIAVHVRGGSSLAEGEGTGDPRTLFVSSDTVFIANGSRVGAGEIALPGVLNPASAPR